MEPRQANGFFVTGTDTGVGKTYVSCALASRARQLARSPVFAFKPVETGCTGELGDDQTALAAAAGGWQKAELRGLYRFAMPAAPRVAAAAEQRRIDLEHILSVYDSGARTARLTIVEGAGGWRVPLTDDTDMSGLARRLALPVVVVARATLGTINHTLLTVEAVERDGLTIAAVVLSKRSNDELAFAHSNAHEISRRWDGRVVLLEQPPDLDTLLTGT